MNQYPILDNPPSYEHAVRDQPGKEKFKIMGKIEIIKIFSATIGETTVVTKSFSSVQPSAPPQIPQNYGSISEIIQSQPAVNTIIVLPSNACPICRIGDKTN